MLNAKDRIGRDINIGDRIVYRTKNGLGAGAVREITAWSLLGATRIRLRVEVMTGDRAPNRSIKHVAIHKLDNVVVLKA
jgi:hypothetical protein